MSCHCNNTLPCSDSTTPESVASQLQNLTEALFGTVTKEFVGGRIVWTGSCGVEGPATIAGVTQNDGEGFSCFVKRAVDNLEDNIIGTLDELEAAFDTL